MTTGKTLIVGAYARRSSDQSDRDEDPKSVTQQIDQTWARAG